MNTFESLIKEDKMIEIERKFLVQSDRYKNDAVCSNRIQQGYLNSAAERTVRIRIKNEIGYLTIKGQSNDSGLSRFEWEKEIPYQEAVALLALCEKGIIDKTRYEIQVGNHIYEVDEFYGENEGLTVAEIELASEEETFIKPAWLGNEVTGNKKYYNSYLSKEPYTSWK